MPKEPRGRVNTCHPSAAWSRRGTATSCPSSRLLVDSFRWVRYVYCMCAAFILHESCETCSSQCVECTPSLVCHPCKQLLAENSLSRQCDVCGRNGVFAVCAYPQESNNQYWDGSLTRDTSPASQYVSDSAIWVRQWSDSKQNDHASCIVNWLATPATFGNPTWHSTSRS
jgi:hypothetical protein